MSRTNKGEKRIKSGDRYYGGYDIALDNQRINQEESLEDELGLFRLASVHKDLGLASRASNAVLANIRIKFITRTDVEVEYVIPIAVTDEDTEGVYTYYSGGKIKEEEFAKFYKSIRKDVVDFSRQSHYHSEPFLVYYLLSKEGKQFLVNEFCTKGLTVNDEEKGHLVSDVKEITEIGIDMHSTKVVCFNCAPFLQAASPKILKAVYWALALGSKPEAERLTEVKFNVSANTNFNHANVSAVKTFDHIPVREIKKDEESKDDSILSNTEAKLGESESRFQKTGEASNRTHFLSGSYALADDVIEIINLDGQAWKLIAEEAAIKIQRTWREFQEKKKVGQTDVSELVAVEDESLVDEMTKISLMDKPSVSPVKSEDVESLGKPKGDISQGQN